MRKQHPEIGATRYIDKFLILPRRIGYESRWLEHVVIYQTFQVAGGRVGQGKWVSEKFVD